MSGMGPIVDVTGDDLAELLDELADLAGRYRDRAYRVSFAIDGGIKIKVNEYTWSPPMGEVRAER